MHGIESIWKQSVVHVSFVELATSRVTTDSANATSGTGYSNSATRLDEDMKRKVRHGSNLSLLVSGAVTHNPSASEQKMGMKSGTRMVATEMWCFLRGVRRLAQIFTDPALRALNASNVTHARGDGLAV
jgi:hypothetical protein